MSLRGWFRLSGKLALALVGLSLTVFMGVALTLIFAPQLVRDKLNWLGGSAVLAAKKMPPTLAAQPVISNCAWLQQNWTDEDRAWFHNASQGTATFPMPYAWFRSLERPEFNPLPRGSIGDPEYLARLGFIPPNAKCDPPAGASAPEGRGILPVGFAVLKGGTDPATGNTYEDALGLTCAACHTGQIIYRGTSLRIDGAPAMIDLQNLERVIGLSLCYTNSPILFWRKQRFVDSLLDDEEDDSSNSRGRKAKIEQHLKHLCDNEVTAKVLSELAILGRRQQAHTEEGFGRLDALNRIGNQVFHESLSDPEDFSKPAKGFSIEDFETNFAARSAPVSFPPIWDVPHFLWAQYDASILNPSVRNIGEAIGVAGKLNMSNPARPLFSSSINVENIDRIEKLLRGKKPPLDKPVGFSGLHAPRWEDAATHFPGDEKWMIDTARVQEGRRLYREFCFECHRGPVRDPEISLDNPDSFWNEVNSDQTDKPVEERNWIRFAGESWLNVVQKPVAEIGTDPEQARVLTQRRVHLPDYLGINAGRDFVDACKMDRDPSLKTSFALNLMAVVKKVEDQWFREGGKSKSPEEQASIRGMLPNCPNPKVFRPMVEKAADTSGDAADRAEVSVQHVLKPHYRARPLDGVWATAPYLHNGSVPTLDDLLKPQMHRPDAFCVGPTEFDPVKVGLSQGLQEDPDECPEGITLLDTRLRGNSNRGHSFEGKAGGVAPLGVIGRELSPDERSALVEYLKIL